MVLGRWGVGQGGGDLGEDTTMLCWPPSRASALLGCHPGSSWKRGAQRMGSFNPATAMAAAVADWWDWSRTGTLGGGGRDSTRHVACRAGEPRECMRSTGGGVCAR